MYLHGALGPRELFLRVSGLVRGLRVGVTLGEAQTLSAPAGLP